MSGTARLRHLREFMQKMYPAFSRRATQVCILSSALEKIALGIEAPHAVALSALNEADAFGWKGSPTAHPESACQILFIRTVVRQNGGATGGIVGTIDPRALKL